MEGGRGRSQKEAQKETGEIVGEEAGMAGAEDNITASGEGFYASRRKTWLLSGDRDTWQRAGPAPGRGMRQRECSRKAIWRSVSARSSVESL